MGTTLQGKILIMKILEIVKRSSFFSILFFFSAYQVTHAEVDLTDIEVQSVNSHHKERSVLLMEWFDRTRIGGFGSFGYVDVGQTSKTVSDTGHFPHQVSLHVEAEIWEDILLFAETSLTTQGTLGLVHLYEEFYLKYKNVLKSWGEDVLHIKIGRFDTPFGEEYLIQDPPDNPMINMSVPFPWGSDEGIEFYGIIKEKINWFLAIQDGSSSHTSDDHPAKSVALKISGDITKNWYLSASYLNVGKVIIPEFWLGSARVSATGTNTTTNHVKPHLYQIDTKIQWGPKLKLWANLGLTKISNLTTPSNSLTMHMYLIQPVLKLTNQLFVAGRYSGVELHGGKTYNLGQLHHGTLLGPLEHLRYAGIGLGYKLNPNNTLKIELGQSYYGFQTTANPVDIKDPHFIGFEATAKF